MGFGIFDFIAQAGKTIKSTLDGSEHIPHHENAPGEAHMGEVGLSGDVIDVTLALDTLIYADGEVLSDTATLTDAMRVNGGKGRITSITAIDEDDQGVAFDIAFFRVTQSLGTKNGAPSISDANARDCLGIVSIATGDYVDLGGVKVATKRDINLMVEADNASKNLFIGTITRGGTPTYTASGIKLRIGIDGRS